MNKQQYSERAVFFGFIGIILILILAKCLEY